MFKSSVSPSSSLFGNSMCNFNTSRDPRIQPREKWRISTEICTKLFSTSARTQMAPLRFVLVALLCVFLVASVAARPLSFPSRPRCPESFVYVRNLGCRKLSPRGVKTGGTFHRSG